MTRGVMVPPRGSCRSPVYLPVLALMFAEFRRARRVIYVDDAFMLVNCTSLNTL